jgi:formate-nitrite transporter family protein
MLLATGVVGGIDVGIGVLAFLVVRHDTHSDLLAGLAFSIGFVALTLASSELFTENFLVPILAVSEGEAPAWAVGRLWIGTWVANLAGGWVISLVIVRAIPALDGTAITVGTRFVHDGFGWTAFASAVLAGTVITLMTWMQHSTESVPAKLLAAIVAGFVLGAGALHHAIVLSLDMFAALHAGAPFGYLDWLKVMGMAAAGNAAGGIGLVTLLRLAQAKAERDRQSDGRMQKKTAA